MENKRFWLGILAVVLVFGLSFTACNTDSGVKYDPVVYTSKDASGNTYKLTITKNTGKAAFTPEKGDSYTLVITYADGTKKTSTGKVATYSSAEISFESATSISFTVTVTSAGTMTKIEGTIPIDGGEPIPAPGTVTPQENNPDGGEPTPTNPFANTMWRAEVSSEEGIQTATLSFGTDTWTFEIRSYPAGSDDVIIDGPHTGTYMVSGNTATLSGDMSGNATISGNVLLVDGMNVPFIRAN